jgi:hypothetical protein
MAAGPAEADRRLPGPSESGVPEHQLRPAAERLGETRRVERQGALSDVIIISSRRTVPTRSRQSCMMAGRQPEGFGGDRVSLAAAWAASPGPGSQAAIDCRASQPVTKAS